MRIPILDLKAQYATIKDEVLMAISEVCESQAFALGPAVAEFERNVAAYCNSRHAIGVSSGSGVGVLLGMLTVNLLTSGSIQSLTLPGNTPQSVTTRVYQEVGEGVFFMGRGGETRVFFLKGKRAAVKRALEREGITAGE